VATVAGFWRPTPGEACLSWAALEVFDAVLLIGGDFASQRQTGIEAQMRDGREGGLLDIQPEIEFADDPAFCHPRS
jgi:hypothetical protein